MSDCKSLFCSTSSVADDKKKLTTTDYENHTKMKCYETLSDQKEEIVSIKQKEEMKAKEEEHGDTQQRTNDQQEKKEEVNEEDFKGLYEESCKVIQFYFH